MRLQDSLPQLRPNTPEVPALISVEALSQHWGVRADTIRAWVRADKIKAIRIGRKLLIDVESLPRAEA